tara:strand:- start:1314 stop:1517 length:204 start_codon:yes stop_codon:yes gene_type:complete
MSATPLTDKATSTLKSKADFIQFARSLELQLIAASLERDSLLLDHRKICAACRELETGKTPLLNFLE